MNNAWEHGGEGTDDMNPCPYDRPDVIPEDDMGQTYEHDALVLLFDPFEGEGEPCPCCAADAPLYVPMQYSCPVCGWERDEHAQTDEYAASERNHGMSLDEARLNFGAFGTSYPQQYWD